ncbi:MAG: GTP cyclohydrolase II [Pseudomonadota bacterium]
MTQPDRNCTHQIERALFDLRRGVPVVVTDGASASLVFPIESLAEDRLDQLTAMAGSPAVLTVTAHRRQAMGEPRARDAASYELSSEAARDVEQLLDAAVSASDDSTQALGPARSANAIEKASLTLLGRALLVPSALTAAVHPDQRASIDQAIASGDLLSITADDAEHCVELGDSMLRRISEAEVPLSDSAKTRFVLFREPNGLLEHLALLIGEREQWPEAVPLRLHSACLTGDLFGSLRCDCGEQLRGAVRRINELGGGVLLYLAQEGRGIGLPNKLRAYQLQDQGLDTIEANHALGFSADDRRYGVALDMLRSLDIRRVHLLTNNPLKRQALANGGIEVLGEDRIYGQITDQNRAYLATKADRAGHLLDDLLDQD